MSFTNFLETEILDHVFGGNAYTAPSNLYLGLYTATPSDTGGGTELSGSGYARLAMAMSVSGNLATNSAAEEFATATGSWGTVTHVGVFDAATSGNLMAYGTLSASKAVATGDVFRIPAGDLDITLT
jgi:hypothetical protein|tara:strand:+ start:2149 stop:2529 length:381 start_codon:yes stop_codon:yes gene_type:complete